MIAPSCAPPACRDQTLDIGRLRRLHARGQLPNTVVEAFDAIGFVWDPAVFKWSTRFAALATFKDLRQNLLVPRSFVVPVGNTQWPRDTWGIKLGVLVHNIRTGRVKIDEPQLTALRELGFVWDPAQEHWDIHVAALRHYKDVYGDVCVPQRFTVPPSWPDARLHGLSLGRFVNSLRQQHDLSQARRDDLSTLGFVWDMPELHWEKKLLALRTYRDLYKDLLVPKSYIVPSDAVWPKALWGLPLGVVVRSLRNSAVSEERRQDLENLGFTWDPLGDQWDVILLALKTYDANFGHLRVPTTFVVPSTEAWPESTWRLHLGSAVTHIRHRADDMSTEQMDLLGLILLYDEGDNADEVAE
ncbi:hypothetical protein SPRG_08848 [Saprolegnia parasitica CBS 223.65]|uniref:Helicase-associated domain-containing protein n=1 Tax=Saprolegnia parasitica (strain CBS 223.65) TaxID=695850 RepID=A0A067CGF9_SAPPC|nr:hypothetical protein SPRG_08848 [Saprolegnia parasitica CBS 223.65]KDO25907.1 hypothetical protein SPRG_08848 [Saprolegnia parasitica CBS 223.65]|eukprot:XP_012203467.1 hypothetical protein SPRG_08848 [Saprolegnia parasitica CBS 223.65]